MIKKILIANRGEIAVRIIKTAKKLGIKTVAIHTNDEYSAYWTKLADDSFLLSEEDGLLPYLNTIRIISIAKKKQCDAIHPGYGFLSENWEFAKACSDENITFIGPNWRTIQLMGNKKKAREFAEKLTIPVPKGLTGSIENIIEKENTLHFPVIIKAVGGGGGKGMHIVHNADELRKKLTIASQDAKKWFNNDQVFIEQYFEKARHIEVQILGDNYGNYLHLFERECTLQRNYQKIIEEAPSPTLNHKQQQEICKAAVQLAQACNYTNAGTIEFLWQNGKFYFLEMNTRIQVEHPVTEKITGVDIVEQQLIIANNKKLSLEQTDINIFGHSIEARIYAENPIENFKPSGGIMHFYKEPELAIRIDSSYNEPANISPKYDGLIAKLIAHEPSRNNAIEKLISALKDYTIHGIEHNISFLNQIASSTDYSNNNVYSRYLNDKSDQIAKEISRKIIANDTRYLFSSVIAYRYLGKTKNQIWSNNNIVSVIKSEEYIYNGQRYGLLVKKQENTIEITSDNDTWLTTVNYINNNEFELVINQKAEKVTISENQNYYWVQFNDFTHKISCNNYLDQVIIDKKQSPDQTTKLSSVRSPLFGSVSKIRVAPKQAIKQGDTLLMIESMKTENQIVAQGDGIIKEILITENDQIKENQILITFE